MNDYIIKLPAWFFRVALYLFAISACSPIKDSAPTEADDSQVRPNILLIVSEDNGPDLGCYGVKEVKSPNLDRLAREGVLFKNAFVPYSVCSPSRGSIFTGLYPHQNGQIGLATHGYRMYDRIEHTMPALLKAAGYRTACLGKVHVNPESAIPFDFHPIKGNNFGKKALPQYAAEAAKFIRTSEDPFFLMVNFPDAHFPLQRQVEGMPAHPISGKDVRTTLPFVGADSERLREFTANYYNSMMRLDESVGMLLDSLEATGKASETLIIYLGDHGAQFSRGKCSNYEAGLRVPFMVKWPGHVPPGQRQEALISSIDLLPTLLDVAGQAPDSELPGLSLIPLMNGKEMDWPREYIFADGVGSAAIFYCPRRSVRDKRYKLIANLLPGRENPKYSAYTQHLNGHFAAGTTEAEIANSSEEVQKAYQRWRIPPAYEFYDLENDPFEFRDLSTDLAYSVEFNRLKHALKSWQNETNDPLSIELVLQQFTAEVDAILEKYPNGDYSKDPDFQWKYPVYFTEEAGNGN